MTKTAVVILNWNGKSWLQKFLDTVVRFSSGEDASVWVADNGSTDGSVEWIEGNSPQTKIIRFTENNGFAGGYNQALEIIKAEYFVILNSDVEVTEGWLKPMIRFMDENPDVASCQPKIRSYYNRDYFEHAGAAGGYIDKYGFPFCRGRIFDSTEKGEGQYNDHTDIFWSSGACMMVRASHWEICGGFDSDFFAHMEEIDLCWRFHKAGFRVSFIPDSVVFHAGGGSLPYESEYKTYLNFRNNLLMLYKNLPQKNLRLTLFKRKILDGSAALHFLLKGKPRHFISIIKAHYHYYKCSKSLKSKRSDILKISKPDSVSQILDRSIVLDYWIKGRKTFSEINSKIK